MRREYPEAPVVGVGGVVLRGDEVLLVKRKHEPLKGQWSLPGGGLELGETLREGVAREILEETGLEIEAVEVVEVLDRIYREAERVQYHYVLVDFLCKVVSGSLQAATDAEDARWVKREQINADAPYALPPITMAVIEKAFQLAGSSRSVEAYRVDCHKV